MIPYDILAKAKTMEAVERSTNVRDCGEQRTDETQEIFRPVKQFCMTLKGKNIVHLSKLKQFYP